MSNAEMTRRVEPDRAKVDPGSVRRVMALTLSGLLAGCAAGPDFARPSAPDVAAYTAAPLPVQTVSAPTALGGEQRLIEGAAIHGAWWRELGSPELDSLIDNALQASPTLVSAQATLRQAQEVQAAQAGSTRYPQADAGIGAQRQRFSPGTLGQSGDAREFTVYNASVDVHYNLDLAGGNRRALEALAPRADYRRYQLEGARLSLAANIVATAVTQAQLSGQIHATQAILDAQEEQLHLSRERVRIGQGAPDDVLALQTQVEQTRAGVPVLRQQRLQTEHLLAVLVGLPPGASSLPSFTLARRLLALVSADDAAQGSLKSMQRQYALGAASYVQLLIALQQAHQNRSNLIAAQAQRLLDSAALYQAMGGGWVASSVTASASI